MKKKTFSSKIKLAQSSLLCAVVIIMSFLESFLDFAMPVPGIRLGLSNVMIAFGIELLGFIPTICIVIIKAMFAGITRGVTAGVMSFLGGILSFVAMYVCIKSRYSPFGYLGVGIIGALCHNFGQFIGAFIIVGDAIIAYSPILAFSALITGCITGISMGILNPRLLLVLNKTEMQNIGA
ncbi:MAG: Gx transporter family protein [Clostridia bacterium]|nr:Gx transporter family protein [Clostridia bacterium]